MALVGTVSFAQSNVQKDKYVSSDIVSAMKSGKFYMKMNGKQSYSEDGTDYKFAVELEIANKAGVSMSRTSSNNMNAVMLTTSKGSYQLNEKEKTWTFHPQDSNMPGMETLKFSSQGTCKVNGQDGWYYDEYKSSDGTSFTFYYNSDKVSIIDIGGFGEGFGPMNLISFSSRIPSNMYFCVGNDWKAASGGADQLSQAGMDRKEIEKQIREGLKGQKLPPGMSIDDLVNQALGAMGSSNNVKAGAANAPAPPRCATPWTDNSPENELACGIALSSIAITGKTRGGPYYLASMKPSAAPAPGLRTDIKITVEGLTKAFEQLVEESRDKTEEQVAKDIMDFNNQAVMTMTTGVITGEMVEMAMVRCQVCPDPALLNTTGQMLSIIGEPQKAVEYFQAAQELQPDFAEPYFGEIECYLDMNDLPKARKIVPKIIEICDDGTYKDGKTYLYRAMLDAQDGKFYDAVDNFFLSLRYGYFDENSAMMAVSLKSKLEEARIMAVGDEFPDYYLFLQRVFNQKNMDNLHKAVAYGLKDFHYEAEPKTITLNFSSDIINNYASYEKTGNLIHERMEFCGDKINKYNEDPINAVYMTMGMEALGNGLSGMLETAKDLKEVKKLSGNPRVAKEIESMRLTEGAQTAMSMAPGYVSDAAKMKYDVDMLFLPDALPYWSLSLMQYYWQKMLEYADGDMAVVQEDDNGNFTFKGVCPQAYKNKVLDLAHNSKEYSAKHKALEESWQKKVEAKGLETAKKVEKLVEALAGKISDEELERRIRIIERPYVLMLMVEMPTDLFNQISLPQSTFIVNKEKDYFNNTIKPVLDGWWKDASKYSQYCFQKETHLLFKYEALYEIYSHWSGPYFEAAREGCSLATELEFIEEQRRRIMDEAEQEHKAAEAKYLIQLQAEKDSHLFPEDNFFGLSDLHLDINTPTGRFKIGFIDKKLGFSYTDEHVGVSWGMRGTKGFIEDIFTNTQFVQRGLNASNLTNKLWARSAAKEAINGIMGKLMGNNMFNAAMALNNIKKGEFLKNGGGSSYTIIKDAQGNLHKRYVDEKTLTINKMLTLGSQQITRGAAKKRKATFSFSAIPFVNINGGQYQ